VRAGRNVVSDYNIVHHPASGKFLRWLGTSHNWLDWKRFAAQDENSLKTDPGMRDPMEGDFRLTEGSPCIDRGEDLGLSRDLAGNPVPNGSKPDIGAHEYYDE